jgi:Polysaccharide lyase family 4, domain II
MSVDGHGDGYAKLNQDYSFRFGSTLPGHYYLRPNLPGGLYVKAALAGEVDILASGLDLSSEASAPLEVVMNSHPARIVGTVRDPETRRAASFAIVVLVPQEAGRREQSWYYATSTADRSGNFNFKNVPPGNYRAYAWDEVEDGAYMDADFLKAFEANAVDVSLKEGDQVSKDLDVSSSATILGTARRRP